MAQARRSRVSLGDLMLFVVASAIYMAPNLSRQGGGYAWFLVGFSLIQCGTLGVFLFYRRLSGWMWVAVASFFVRSISQWVQQLDHVLNSTSSMISLLIEAGLTSGLFALGCGMSFRDVARKLAACEEAMPGEPPAELAA